MRYYEITVYFESGKKNYRISPQGKAEFMRKMKARNDVIKYTVISHNSFVY